MEAEKDKIRAISTEKEGEPRLLKKKEKIKIEQYRKISWNLLAVNYKTVKDESSTYQIHWKEEISREETIWQIKRLKRGTEVT